MFNSRAGRVCALVCLLASALIGQYVSAPVAKQQFLDASGVPLAGGLVYTYQSGTTVPFTTYQSATGPANTNPIVLDAGGFAAIWVPAGQAYTEVVETSAGVTLYTQNQLAGPSTGGGSSSSSSSSVPAVYATNYAFTPLAPGIALTAAVPASVVLNPCPAGVAGTDKKHNLYITDQNAALNEAVLITGVGTSGPAGSCSVTVTPANNHTSTAYTVGPASGGIQEAENYLVTTFGGGKVIIPQGSYSIKASMNFQPSITFEGMGVKTLLVPASCSMVMFDASLPTHPSSEYTLVSDAVTFKDFVVEGAACTGVNSLYGVRELNSGSTELWSIAGVTFDNVDFDNVHYSIYLDRAYNVVLHKVRTWENSSIQFTDNAYYDGKNSTNITVDKLAYSWHPMSGNSQVLSMTDPLITCVSCEVFFVSNSVFSATPVSTVPAIHIIGGEAFQISNSNIETTYYALAFDPITFTDSNTVYPQYISLSQVAIDQIWGSSMNIAAGTGTAANQHLNHLNITNCAFTNPSSIMTSTPILLNLNDYTSDVTVTGSTFGNLNASGQTAVRIGAFANNIRFDKSDIFTQYSASSPYGTGFTIAGSATNLFGLEDLTLFGYTTTWNDPGDAVTAAATLAIPSGRSQVSVSGSTAITTLNTCDTTHSKNEVTLLFGASGSVTKGNNLHLNSNFGPTTTDGSLSLVCNGSNWIELGRAVN